MNLFWLNYLYIIATIVFTVYGQLILKWRVGFYGQIPSALLEKFKFVATVLFDPWIVSGFIAAFVASLAWIITISKFDLTHAYPFMSLNFVVVLIFGSWLLNEQITLPKIIGISLIMFGTMVAARG